MARPLRIEIADAIYHVTSRGDLREPTFRDDTDRQLFLQTLGTALERFDAQVLAYCLMGNHYHLVLWGAGVKSCLLLADPRNSPHGPPSSH